MSQAREWIIDAFDCAPARITGETGREALMSLFANVVRSANLHPVGQAVWQLVGTGGAVTGMLALVESHLTCHSDPAAAYLSLNLLSHRADMAPDWEALVTRFVGARRIQVRVIERGQAAQTSVAEALAPVIGAPVIGAPVVPASAAAPAAGPGSSAAPDSTLPPPERVAS